MCNEEQKIMEGILFSPGDPELRKMKQKSHLLSQKYSNTTEDETELRQNILEELLDEIGTNSFIQGPVFLHYGIHTKIGKGCFFNYNLTIQDDALVTIGDYCNFGPNVTIVTPLHPMLSEERRSMKDASGNEKHLCYARPVEIGSDCWLGANVVVCPGVKIGSGSVIGAGSVVTRDISANSFAAGVPCKFIRKLTENDSMIYQKKIIGDNMTMKERIKSGKLFTDNCEGMPKERRKCKKHMRAFNASSPTNLPVRYAAMTKLFGKITKAWIEPPFYCCYGTHITIGDMSYINFNCNFVDDGNITIGKKVMFGPAVTIATVGHPINPEMREYMYTDSVTVEDNCWIGAGVTICPGVTIGENSVIGAGSVVVHDIPANSVAVGNPCRVLREINDEDKKFYYKDRPILAEDLEEEKKLRKNK